MAPGVGTDTQKPLRWSSSAGLFTRLLINVFLMPALYARVARENDGLEA